MSANPADGDCALTVCWALGAHSRAGRSWGWGSEVKSALSLELCSGLRWESVAVSGVD